jgi:dephospho-CoA kinase
MQLIKKVENVGVTYTKVFQKTKKFVVVDIQILSHMKTHWVVIVVVVWDL